MSDPSQLSDADLLSAIQRSPDVGALITAEAQRQNVPAQLALGVAHAESGMNPDIGRSPKGAIGPMQLMPGTARDMGVDPTDLHQNIAGGVSYLKQQLDRFKDPSLAAAAYNAGPEAVARHGGIPPYPETQAYVQKVNDYGGAAQMSDADLLKALGQGAPDAAPATAAPAAPQAPQGSPTTGMNNGRMVFADTGEPIPDAQVQTIKGLAGQLDPKADEGALQRPFVQRKETDTFAPGKYYIDKSGKLTQVPTKPSVADDAVSGLEQPLVNLGHDVMQNYRAKIAQAQAPAPSLLDAGKQAITDVGTTGRIVGDVLGAVPSALTGAFVRPTARAMTDYGPTPYAPGGYHVQGGKLAFQAPVALHGDQAQAANESLLNTALSGARAAPPGWKFGAGYGAVEAAAPRSLEQMREASEAAWTAVDKSNYRFPKTDAVGMAKDVATTFEDAGGADLYPRTAPLVRRINNLANGSDGLSVAQVNRLRSQIGSKLLQPGSDEADMGAILKDKVEGLIQTAKDPELADARDIYTRLKKMQEVTDRADSAALKTPQNGSAVQPTRTAMRPLVDPKSPQRIRNLTPDETAAITKLAKGKASDWPLAIGRFFDPRSVIGSTSNLILGALTGGHAPLVTAPLGVASTATSNAQTRKAVQSVLDLISAGGMKPGASPVYPTLALGGRPAPPILSGQGLIGGSALATLPARMSSARANANKR